MHMKIRNKGLLFLQLFLVVNVVKSKSVDTNSTTNTCDLMYNLLQVELIRFGTNDIWIFLLDSDFSQCKFIVQKLANFKFIAIKTCSTLIKNQANAKSFTVFSFCGIGQTFKILRHFLIKSNIWIWIEPYTFGKQVNWNFTVEFKQIKISHLILFKSEANNTLAVGKVVQIWLPIPDGTVVEKVIFSRTNSRQLRRFQNFPVSVAPFSESLLSDFGSQPIKVAGVMDPAYAYDTLMNKTVNNTYIFLPSFAVDILIGLELTLNFTTVPLVTSAWGHLNNSKWQGMIQLLLDGQAHLAISSTADKPFRREVVHFNFPTTYIYLSCFFRRPLPSLISNPLSRPFTFDLWMIFGTYIFITGVASAVILGIIRYYGNAHAQSEWTLVDCFQWSLSSACFKGYTRLPERSSLRILVATALLASVVIYNAYEAKLLSFLFTELEPITSIHELVRTKFRFLVAKDPLALKLLSESTDWHHQQIFKRGETIYNGIHEGVKDVKKGNTVFVADDLNGYESLARDFSIEEACQMREIKIADGRQRQGSMVKKGAEISRVVDYQLLRMTEFGLISKLRQKYLQKTPTCDERRREFDGVQFEAIYIALLFLSSAALLAFTLLIFEFIWKQRQKQFEINTQASFLK